MTLAVVPLQQSNVANALRTLADQLDRGELTATSAIVVCNDRVSQVTSRHLCGEHVVYSAWLGFLAYASHMLYAECRDNG